jgi:pimeloyl-ACP methyl ester carboxylesterase
MRNKIRLIIIGFLATFALVQPSFGKPKLASERLVISARQLAFASGKIVAAEEGILEVPENRLVKKSRKIALHFWRVKSVNPTRPPLFILPGGPGSKFVSGRTGEMGYNDYGALESDWGEAILALVDGKADVIFLDQRGNLDVAMSSALSYTISAADAASATPGQDIAMSSRQAVIDAQKQLAASGVDTRGYDILHMADDVETVRHRLGYKKIMLSGGSFGSQWSLAYLRRYPENVDRAVLDGVEPLDYGYDSPADLDNAVLRVMEQADRDPKLASGRPEGGFVAALRRVYARLKAGPVDVEVLAENSAAPQIVRVGQWDLTQALKNVEQTAGVRDGLQQLPRMIAEADRGDLRHIAATSLEMRAAYTGPLIGMLIDSSLGISAKRDQQLLAEAQTALVGELSDDYRMVAPIIATPTVGDSFRGFAPITTPVLLLQGDMDFSTPSGNAEALLPWLRNGGILRVKGGTHNVLNELRLEAPEYYAQVGQFLLGGRAQNSTATLPAIKFEPLRPDMPICAETGRCAGLANDNKMVSND